MPVDQYGIWYSGDLSKEKPATGGAPLMPAPGGNVAEPPKSPFGTETFPGGGSFSRVPGTTALEPGLTGPSPFEQTLPQPFSDWTGVPGGFGGTSPSTGDFGTGSQRGAGWMDFANSYTTGGKAPLAPKNDSGQGAGGGQGYAGTGPISVGAGQDRAAQNAAVMQRNEMLRQLFQSLYGGGQGRALPTVPTPPDLFGYAQQAIQAELTRQQTAQANEAAATGAAGSRDLGYRQGLLGSQAMESIGRIAPAYQAQQFQLASQQAQNEYARQIAEFNQMIKLIAAMGGPGGSFI